MKSIVPFSKSHIYMIRDDDPEYQALVREHVELNARSGIVFSCIDHGNCLGVGGLKPDADGSYYAWLWVSPVLRAAPVFLHRSVWETLNHIQRKMNITRITAHVDRSFRVGHKWVKRLGFVRYAALIWDDPEKEDQVFYEMVRIGS